MAYTHGSNTGTHGRVRTQGHSNGDELTLTGKLLYSVYAGVLHAGALSRPGYSGLGLMPCLMQRSSVGEDWVVFSWACRGAEGLRVVTPVHVDPRSSDSDSSSTAKNVYIPLISLAWTP